MAHQLLLLLLVLQTTLTLAYEADLVSTNITSLVDVLLDQSVAQNYQPRVTIVQKRPATKSLGSVSMPEGSPWCDKGQRMIWMVGHQYEHESPYCEKKRGKWRRNGRFVLDVQDELNARDGDNHIDRHACSAMDVNKDGVLDLICGVGADSGAKNGASYNEVYLTNETEKRLEKVLEGHGLQTYTMLRNRKTVVVKGRGKDEFIFFGIKNGGSAENLHRMFVNNYKKYDIQPWFEEIEGPWRLNFHAACAVAAPFKNGQEFDDLIVCDQKGPALLVKQGLSRSFERISLKGPYVNNWRSARVHDVDRDGKPDLVVTTFPKGSKPKNYYETTMLYIFRGGNSDTIFDFDKPWFSLALPHAAPDIEIVQVNDDQRPDIYVVQANELKGEYCGPQKANDLWGGSTQPPKSWIPPRDKARDILLLGQGDAENPFLAVKMKHSLPGCGYLAQYFGDGGKAMVLSQGEMGKPGYHLLLEW